MADHQMQVLAQRKYLAVLLFILAGALLDGITTWYGLTFAGKSELNPFVPVEQKFGIFYLKFGQIAVLAGIALFVFPPNGRPSRSVITPDPNSYTFAALLFVIYVSMHTLIAGLSNIGEIFFDYGLADIARGLGATELTAKRLIIAVLVLALGGYPSYMLAAAIGRWRPASAQPA